MADTTMQGLDGSAEGVTFTAPPAGLCSYVTHK